MSIRDLRASRKSRHSVLDPPEGVRVHFNRLGKKAEGDTEWAQAHSFASNLLNGNAF
jgi:hypothetical protein